MVEIIYVVVSNYKTSKITKFYFHIHYPPPTAACNIFKLSAANNIMVGVFWHSITSWWCDLILGITEKFDIICMVGSEVVLKILLYIYYRLDTLYRILSSTLPEIDPDTAYVVCISVSLGFRQKPSDTALLLVIALTTFNCIVSASVTKGALICFVVTVHWWRHGTHYDVTEAYHALLNILTVHLNNGATRADLRGIPKHWEVTAKAGRQSTIYTGDFDAICFIIRYGTNPYSYSGFLWVRCSPWDIEQVEGRAFGPRASLDRWRTPASLAGDVIQVWINSSPSNHCIFHYKAQLAQLFLI